MGQQGISLGIKISSEPSLDKPEDNEGSSCGCEECICGAEEKNYLTISH